MVLCHEGIVLNDKYKIKKSFTATTNKKKNISRQIIIHSHNHLFTLGEVPVLIREVETILITWKAASQDSDIGQ